MEREYLLSTRLDTFSVVSPIDSFCPVVSVEKKEGLARVDIRISKRCGTFPWPQKKKSIVYKKIVETKN
jgi:hypothetical protein